MMKRRLASVFFILMLLTLDQRLFAQPDRNGIQPAADAPQPRTPEESRAQVKLPAGFRLELVASEPLVREPSGVCWDERGRMFVCELHGYNLEGHYDVEELNKTGQLDRVVRRIQADERAKQMAAAGTFGTVKLLLDTDGDGRMDKAEIWADDLPPCYGLCAARGGIIVACTPDIVFLADRDGDGRPEVREKLFTGFTEGILERRLNAPQWGLDDWIYFGTGHGGSQITGPHLKEPVELPRTDFRIKADGSAIEPVSGITWGLGFTFTESGERFISSVGWPATYVVPLPWHYLARNPYLATPSLNDQNPPDRRAYPISQPHPWRTRRATDPGFAKFYTDRYGVAESAPNGYFTSCCSPLVYRDVTLPGLRGQLLACEPAQNLITRMELVREGLRLVPQRLPVEAKSEFLASTDQWFHPIAMSHAPDGTIVISDFYREIIEDYSAIPRYLQQQYGLIKGKDHGRLWRLTHEDAAAAPHPDMRRLDAQQLAREVGNRHFWRRETARRLLVERGDVRGVPTLAALVRESKDAAAISTALMTLQGMRQLKPADVNFALASADASVRARGLLLAEPWLDKEPALLEKALSLAQDNDPSVRLQLALSLGECRDSGALPVLARLAAQASDEPWLAIAIGSSVSDSADRLIAELLGLRSSDQKLSAAGLSMLDTLASVVGAQRDENRIGQLLATVAALDQEANQIQTRLLAGLIQGLKSGRFEKFGSTTGLTALGSLLSHRSPEVRSSALQVAGLLRLRDSSAMKAAWAAAVTSALDDSCSLDDRISAVSVLHAGPYAAVTRLKSLLDARQPLELQLAVVRTMAAAVELQVVDDLTGEFAKLSPDVQSAIVDAICSRQDRLPRLLDMIERQVIVPTDLPALRRVQLLEHPNGMLRARAARLLAAVMSDDRKEVLERYRAALTAPRDAARGKLVFEKTCAKCHQLGKQGFAVGPELDSVRTRPDESLLLDILDPSGTINPKFRTYTVVTADGRVSSGLLAGESATSIILRREKNETETILRKDIDELKASSKSLMPDGIEKEISPQQLVDLFAYLRESLGPTLASRHVLFDDEPAFVDALKDGDGIATLVTNDRHSGQAALQMTPLQRSAVRIPGWNFRIVERPQVHQPGEPEQFRYLRLAWKSIGATGVMVELADSGAWPPADKPLRRYYSGKNTTPWQATLVSTDLPTDWTVMTVDLWKDFGEFTLTGIAPTAMEGPALFDGISLLRTLDE